MISSDKKELMLTCNCNCEDTLHFKINDEDKDYDCYAVQSYLKGDWYTNQDNTIWSVVVKKLKNLGTLAEIIAQVAYAQNMLI